MIDFFRKNSRSWFSKIVIGLFAGGLIATVFENYRHGFSGSSSVAIVGGEEVTGVDFIRRLRQRSLEMNIDVRSLAASEQMRAFLLNQMVQEHALAAEAAEAGIDAPDWAVLERLQAHPAFQTAEGGFADSVYQRALASWGGTREEFEGELRHELIGQALLASLQTNLSVPRATTELIWRREGQERDLSFMTLPLDAVTAPEEVDDATLGAYYEENKERFARPERRKIRILALLAEDVMKIDEVAEEDVASVYERNIDQYVKPERRNLRRLQFPNAADAEAAIARINDGESFAAIAAEQGLEAADTDLGYVTKQELELFTPELAEAAFAATAANESVVGPTVMPDGTAYVTLIAGVEPGLERTLDDVREEITRGLALAAARDALPQLSFAVEDLRSQGLDFDTIAEQEKFRVIEAVIDADGLDASGAPAEGLPADPGLPARAFDMLVGEEMDLIETPGTGEFYAIEVVEIQRTFIPELQDITEEAIAAWRAAERLRLLDEKAEEIRARLGAGEDAQTLAAEFGLDLSRAEGLKRADAYPELPPAVIAAAFAAPAAEAVGTSVVEAGAGGQARIIARVEAVRELDAEADAASYEEVATRARTGFEQDVLQLFSIDVLSRQITTADPEAATRVLQQVGLVQAGGHSNQ